jgi:pimeloyl-ACP methyl ester carboxylesterase
VKEELSMRQKAAQCEDAFVDIQGVRVHYLHAGAGRPMLLIHGLVGSSSNWRRNIDALAQDRSVYAIDLVNTGKSERIAGLDAGLAATADRVAAAMYALGLDQADIAGHSHGGAVALMLAARYPERVRSLMLFAPVNPFCSLPGPMIRLYSSAPGRMLAKCAPYLPQRIQLIALGRMYGDPARIGKGCMKEYVDGLRVPGTIDHILSIVRSWFADMASLKIALPLIASIPTLLVWGDRDRALSMASGVRLKKEMTASELVVVPGGGHVVFEEMPEDSNRIMLDWLRRDPVSSTLAASERGSLGSRLREQALTVPSPRGPERLPRYNICLLELRAALPGLPAQTSPESTNESPPALGLASRPVIP